LGGRESILNPTFIYRYRIYR